MTLVAFRVLAGPKAAWRLVAGYTAGFFMLMALIAYGKRQRINISALSIGIDFMQVVSIFTSFGFQWPSGLSAIFTAASAATFNDQLLAPECTLQGWTFESKWFAVQLVPAAFVFLLVLLWIGKGVVVRREQGWACCVLGCVLVVCWVVCLHRFMCVACSLKHMPAGVCFLRIREDVLHDCAVWLCQDEVVCEFILCLDECTPVCFWAGIVADVLW